jgi:hypothetical protein
MKNPKDIIALSPGTLDFYQDREMDPRFSGIYAQGIDRWILVDSYDPWIVHETAKIISSKVPVITYRLPNNIGTMTNANCFNFFIFNKTAQKAGQGAVSMGKQTPVMLKIWDPTQIVWVGVPEDYKTPDGEAMLKLLKDYINYVHKVVYATELMNVISNFDDTQEYAVNFLPKEWTANMYTNVDRSGFDNGIAGEIKKILYSSNSIAEAESKIVNLWLNNSNDLPWQRFSYYNILGQPMPEVLRGLKNSGKFTYFSV